MNRKQILLAKRKKSEILNKSQAIPGISNIQICEPRNEWISSVKKLMKIDYPIYKEFIREEMSSELLKRETCFNEGETIIIPYYMQSEFWVSLTVVNKELYINYLLSSNSIRNLILLCISKDKIQDFSLGEDKIELRVGHIINSTFPPTKMGEMPVNSGKITL